MQSISIFMMISGIILTLIGIVMILEKKKIFKEYSSSYVITKASINIAIGIFSIVSGLLLIIYGVKVKILFYAFIAVLVIGLLINNFVKK